MTYPYDAEIPGDYAAHICRCTNPDDQYLLEVDCGSASLTHKACGKQPASWLDDAFSMSQVPVTLHWHDGRPTHPEDDDSSHGQLTVNDRAVICDGKAYLIGRVYREVADGDLWRITGDVDKQGQPLMHLVAPDGKPRGGPVPIGRVANWLNTLTLQPLNTLEETRR